MTKIDEIALGLERMNETLSYIAAILSDALIETDEIETMQTLDGEAVGGERDDTQPL